jgi:hypothetical protein
MWSPLLRDATAGHRPLAIFGLICLPLAVVAAALGLVDNRLVTGAPVWNKPFKFFVSVGIYSLTYAWYLGQWRGEAGRLPRLAFWLGTGVWVALSIELLLISVQASRGVTSHFNLATSFDARIFNVMGVMILGLSIMHAILWVMLLRARWPNRARLSALRWGAGVTLIGLAVGPLMVRPTPQQITELRAGTGWVAGAHAVGVPDGGPGLPLVNWSTEAGDRRVSHFVGLHAMQVVPAVVLLAPAAWSPAAMLLAVRATGVAWSTLVILLMLQAQQARPLLRPGAALASALVLVAGAWIAAMLVARSRGASGRSALVSSSRG